MRARPIYEGSNGEATKIYYAELLKRGAAGIVAMNLFRAQKASTRAKLYRGGGFKGQAYQKKEWSLGLLVDTLVEHGPLLGITFGWGVDEKAYEAHRHVLYIDLPQGQVSFHGTARGKGADYPGQWDGARGMSPVRILQYCDHVMGLEPEQSAPAPALPPRNASRRQLWNERKNAEAAAEAGLFKEAKQA